MLSVFSDEYFMKEALKEAEKAFETGEVPVGAVVVCKNRVIARAHNQTERLTDVTAHAEMLALTASFHNLGSKFLPDCDLFVTLEPCTMCAGAIFWSRIRRLIYAAPDPKRGFTLLRSNVLHPKTEVQSGILATESAQLLSFFFNKLRN